jgi:hypothetical protein
MPMRRLGRLTHDPMDTTKRNLKTLPWADAGKAALARYLGEKPSAEDLARVETCQVTPLEYLEKPHLRDWSLSNEVLWMFGNLMATLDETLDTETALKVAYAAGLTHGKRWLGTFLSSHGLSGGPEAMAMWNDTGHSGAGPRTMTALFARYDDELVEVVRTVDAFNLHTDKQSPAALAFFDGLHDGYQAADPKLSYAEELVLERPDGGVAYIHRYWYLPE